MMILNLSESLAKPLVMAKLNMAYLSSLNKRAKLLSSYLLVSPHRTIWCRSTFGPRGPGLSNPTSFLRPALPMAPTTDNNARDERSVPRPNPATFLSDFTLYMTSNDAILWKRCLNYVTCLTLYCIVWPIGNMWFQLKLQNNSCNRGLSADVLEQIFLLESDAIPVI